MFFYKHFSLLRKLANYGQKSFKKSVAGRHRRQRGRRQVEHDPAILQRKLHSGVNHLKPYLFVSVAGTGLS